MKSKTVSKCDTQISNFKLRLDKLVLPIFILALILVGCAHKAEHADLVIHNAIVYTLDEEGTVTEAIAIKDGKIIETGKERHILNKYSADEYVDAKGRPVYPGFFDAHCHILNYGKTFLEHNLTKYNSSWQEILDKVKLKADKDKSKWIIGRGWDQNEWANKKFPTKSGLDQAFPNQPVYFVRVDGHAAVVNSKALELAGITNETKVEGGTIMLENGEPNGILIDNAMDLVTKVIPPVSEKDMRKAIVQAGANTTSYGLTTLCDAGSSIDVFKLIEKLQDENKFMSRVYGMLEPTQADFDFAKKEGKFNHKNQLLIQSFKIVSDGALGSRGACLKSHYSDEATTIGKLLFNPRVLDSLLGKMYDLNYQVNTHCIGDSANSLMIDLYGKYLEKTNDLRWRIEHAQVVSLNDIQKFAKYSIIPSVQPTHAISDMPWALDRVGNERIKGAYAYQTLLKQNGIIALGTDFPVEEINPFKTYYAAVTRKYYDGKPIPGFANETLSRMEALLGMTKWAARSVFMEEFTGTLEAGKCADIIILNHDILKVGEADILKTLVIQTYINGKRVHSLE